MCLSEAYGIANKCTDYYLFDKNEKVFRLYNVHNSKKEVELLKRGLQKHFSLKELTVGNTRLAFLKYLDIIDPGKVLLSREDLENVGFGAADFYSNLHNQLFEQGPSLVHIRLAEIALSRLNSTIKEFSNNRTMRAEIFAKAREMNFDDNGSFRNRADRISEIDGRLKDYVSKWTNSQAEQFEVATGSSNRPIQKMIVKLKDLIGEYRNNFADEYNQLSIESVSRAIAKSYFQTFDRYSDVLLPSELLDYQKSYSIEKKVGIGFTFVHSLHGYEVTRVLDGGTAQKSGLQVGDQIVAINSSLGFNRIEGLMGRPITINRNWESVRNLSMSDVSSLISGPEKTYLMLRVNRAGEEKVLIVERREFASAKSEVSPVKIEETPSGPIGIVEFNGFTNGISKEVSSQLKKIVEEKKLKGLVLDLRNNPGGSVDEMANFVDMFVPTAKVAMLMDKNQPYKDTLKRGIAEFHWEGPLVVLVNELSASSTEALTAALKDYQRAVVVGTPTTYGKGSAYATFPDGLRVSNILFFSPLGNAIQWHGVDSDIVLMQTHSQYKRERDFENSLKPRNGMVRDSKDNPKWKKTIEDLKLNSKHRIQSAKRPDNDVEIEKFNLDEAVRILSELILRQ